MLMMNQNPEYHSKGLCLLTFLFVETKSRNLLQPAQEEPPPVDSSKSIVLIECLNLLRWYDDDHKMMSQGRIFRE